LPSDAQTPVQFLSLDEVLAIHERLIERFGGATGVRDHGLLESALFRPQTGYYDTLEEMAAAMFESLLINHPFVDGNKRVAFFSTDVFLRLNGYRLRVEAQSAHRFLMERFSTGTCTHDRLLPWIRGHLERLS
jgi:death-on-curing protein